MSATSPQQPAAKPVSPLTERLTALETALKRIIEDALNWLFSFSPEAGEIRNAVRAMLFTLLWLYWTVTLYDLEAWKNLLLPLRDALIKSDMQLIIIESGLLAFRTFFRAEVLRHLLMLAAPYLLAREMAAIYLADIFEKEAEVARKFLSQAAFGENYATIRITQGAILADQQGSTIVQIGGPGFLSVDLDSAVLFERPDGSAHVIGPTAISREKNQPIRTLFSREKAPIDRPKKNRVAISAFERIRQCVDLRTINGSQDVSARSRDGIPVKARDVQYTYSIFRGEKPELSLQNPYPFDKEALVKMVYGPPRPVKVGGAPNTKPDWIESMPGKIVGNVANGLGGFISQRSLTAFFAAIGKPEEEALLQRATGVQNAGLSLAGESSSGNVDTPLQAPAFTSRASLSERLLGDLEKSLPNSGRQIHWLGVGTWDTPAEIIPANHLAAWKMSQENRTLRSKDNLTKLYKDANQNELAALIRQMPLEAYVELDDDVRADKITEAELIDALLKGYHQRLLDAQKYLQEHNETASKVINTALEMLNHLYIHQTGSDYYIGYRVFSKESDQITGAIVYRSEMVVASVPLSTYEMTPINFDFLDAPSLIFTLGLEAEGVSVTPGAPQEKSMGRDDIFIQATFDVTLLPGDTANTHLTFGQRATLLDEFNIPLP